ncbi:calcium-activated chloride channel-domain-containing protein [Chytriomyces sp. MP71]|nr:calcium-activated chloride channel-domain-containing protein [Chytriomyces sp. MP71]
MTESGPRSQQHEQQPLVVQADTVTETTHADAPASPASLSATVAATETGTGGSTSVVSVPSGTDPSDPLVLAQVEPLTVEAPKDSVVVLILGHKDSDKGDSNSDASIRKVVSSLVRGGLDVVAVPLEKGRVAVRITAPDALLVSLRRDEEAHEGARFVVEATVADRVRMLHNYITTSKYNHGCGVLVGGNLARANKHLSEPYKWVGGECVQDCLILHDESFQKKWIDNWANSAFVSFNSLTQVQQHMGESVGFYFHFSHFYLRFLVPLAIVGLICFLFFPAYSHFYALALPLWGIVFTVAWRRQEISLAETWGAVGASKTDRDRPEFVPDSLIKDDMTGEEVPYYPFWKRWIVHAFLTVPVILLFSSAVVAISTLILTTEVYTATVYEGPYKQFAFVAPILIYVLSLPLISTLYFLLADFITNLENSPSRDQHMASLARKSFIMTLSLIQLPLLLSGLIFIPLSDLILPSLNQAGVKVDITEEARNLMSPASLQEKVISFAITAQLANQALQVALPPVIAYAKSLVFPKPAPALVIPTQSSKQAQVQAWASEIERNAALPIFNIYDRYAEIANQFALLLMFSSAWPLVGLCCLVNIFLELRATAWTICRDVRRPVPHRTESIAPWGEIFGVLGLAGTMITTLLRALYANWDLALPASHQTLPKVPLYLATVLIAEHAHVLVKYLVNLGMSVVWGDVEALGERRRRFVRLSGKVEEAILKKEGGEAGVTQEVENVMEVVDAVLGVKRKEE